MRNLALQDIEIGLFLEALYQGYGYDFRHYAKASLKRRILGLTSALQCGSVSELIPRLLHEEAFLNQVLGHLSVPVSDMFRDPPVFLTLRNHVLPLLATYPRFNIWQAGCATGEEVYSLAILLEEAGLLDRVQIYATDINDGALQSAEDGIFPLRSLEDYRRNYQSAGGKADLADYYTAGKDFFRMKERLRKKIVFAHHNLVSDGVFCEVQLILCRNVMIYFDNTLQKRVLALFHESLVRGGILCLGTQESIRSVEGEHLFTLLYPGSMIFQKVSHPFDG